MLRAVTRKRSQKVDLWKVGEMADFYIPNDYEIYKRHFLPLVDNYEIKLRRGKFDRTKAVKGIINVIIKTAITKYRKEVNRSCTMAQAEKVLVAKRLWHYMMYKHLKDRGLKPPKTIG